MQTPLPAPAQKTYGYLTQRIESFQREGRQVPDELLNGRHNLLNAWWQLNMPCPYNYAQGGKYHAAMLDWRNDKPI